MNDKSPYGIGSFGRWWIFSGASMFVMALAMSKWPLLDYIFGQKASPYVFLGICGIVTIISLVLYDYIPKRLVIPIGIIGWILTLSFLCWFFCFGPGAFGHHWFHLR